MTRAPMSPRAVATAALIGTSIEWYDFFLYGTAVVLVLGPLFFPTSDPLLGTLLAFSTFGVGFLVRPLGAVVLAHFGDRVGRKQTLVFSLVLMGVATVAVGLLPTYEQIGLWAPGLLVLLRCAQGFAVGGEWGGAVLLAVEHAPAGKRVLYGAFPQFGTPIGLLASSVAILAAQVVSGDAFLVWGWRLPFLGSAVLVAVGLWLRLRAGETEEYLVVRRSGTVVRRPLAEVVRRHRSALLLGIGTAFLAHTAYITTSFLPSYASSTLRVGTASALVALVTASSAAILVLVGVARWGERVDRRTFCMAGGLLSGAWVVPSFLLPERFGGLGLVVGVTVGLAAVMLQYGVVSSLLADQFPVPVRYTGISLCFQLSAVVGGGLVPLLASWGVSNAAGHYWPAAAMLAVAGTVTAVAARRCRPGQPGQPGEPGEPGEPRRITTSPWVP